MLQQISENYPELSVVLVDSGEGAQTVRDFAKRHSLTFTILLDQDKSISNLYHIYSIPTEIFIDSDGVVRSKNANLGVPAQLEAALQSVGVEP